MKRFNLFYLTVILLFVSTYSSLAYKQDANTAPVHQHITKEALEIWKSAPYEIKNHASNPLNTNLDFRGIYQPGNDMVTGSGEEDKPPLWMAHFWDPDNPQSGEYNDGLEYLGKHESSYRKAVGYWYNYVIPYYLGGKIDESYYWLGRIAHLLEDATVPAHMHDDIHAPGYGDDSFEEFMVNQGYWTQGQPNYEHFKGSNYKGEEYKFEDLDFGFTEADWLAINPRLAEPGYPKELFKLFWYTAQKTQYWASDDRPNNMNYQYANGAVRTWDCGGTGKNNLWVDEGYTVCPQFTTMQELADDDANDDSGPDLAQIANANIPHAMKATAGLYRLFWDAVQVYWPTFHHDNRRTGYTILKGDFDGSSPKEASWKLAFFTIVTYVPLWETFNCHGKELRKPQEIQRF